MVERKAPARKPRPKAAAKPEPTPEKAPDPVVDPNYHDGDGYVGVTPDETPDEHYSLQGVIAGKPVPEHNR